jgi:hypothetical protein
MYPCIQVPQSPHWAGFVIDIQQGKIQHRALVSCVIACAQGQDRHPIEGSPYASNERGHNTNRPFDGTHGRSHQMNVNDLLNC